MENGGNEVDTAEAAAAAIKLIAISDVRVEFETGDWGTII